jgi:hypothetical protein
MASPEDVESRFTLLTAVARYEQLRSRDALSPAGQDPSEHDPQTAPLSRDEALELLALGEVIVRKAGYGRQLSVRTARATGASWSQIGVAIGTSKQSAWETHARWLEEQESAEEDRDG